MKSKFAGASMMMLALASPAHAADPVAIASGSAPAQATAPTDLWIPPDFAVPTLIEGPGFKLVPLGPDVVKVDYDAYMSSIEHLQQTFTRSTSWPRAGITDAEAMQDMKNEQERFVGRKSFAYAVLTPDGSRERGSIYVRPSPFGDYDAVVRMWVTKADFEAGFDAELFKWVTGWIERDWPFRHVAYPGRAISWDAWDSLLAASKAETAAP